MSCGGTATMPTVPATPSGDLTEEPTPAAPNSGGSVEQPADDEAFATPTGDYLTQGFSLDNQGIRLVAVEDTEGISVASGGQSQLAVTFSPDQRTLNVVSTKAAFDGTVDTERVTYRNGSQGSDFVYFFDDNTGTGDGVNQAYLRVGDYAFSGHANLDEDDGRFRHTVSFAEGLATEDMPTGGSGYYLGPFDGTMILQRATPAGKELRTTALDGRVIVDVDFASQSFEFSNIMTNAVSGSSVGAINGVGRLNGPRTSDSSLSGTIRVDGTNLQVDQGGVVLGIAGGNAQEVSGTMLAGGTSNAQSINRSLNISGAFFGVDERR